MPTVLQKSASLQAEPQSSCFVCGPMHPTGLRLQFELSTDGAMEADWAPQRTWEGFSGIIHGGIVCTVLDEAMSKAVSASAVEALTAEIRVRFRHRIQPGREYTIRGWIVGSARRRILTEAVVTGVDGEEFAHAWGTFLAVSGGERRSKAIQNEAKSL